MKNRDREKKWNDSVAEARKLQSLKAYPQFEIARLCLSVCEITWGGAKKKIKENHFTITRFAQETGISAKTLSNWCAVYRNIYTRLPDEIRDRVSYTDMAFLSKDVNRKTPAELVIEKTKKYLEEDSYEIKIIRYMRHIRSLAHNFEKNATTFRVKTEVLEEISFYCTSILRGIRRDKRGIKPKDHNLHRFGDVRLNSIARYTLGERMKPYDLQSHPKSN